MARESKRKREERRFGRPERLADLIFSDLVMHPSFLGEDEKAIQSWDQTRRRIFNALSRARVISADNVCDYTESFYVGKYVDYYNDIPNYRPPFSPVFVECHGDLALGRHGFLIQYFAEFGDARLPMTPPPDLVLRPYSGIVFAEHFFTIIREGERKLIGPASTFLIMVNEDGSLANDVIGNVAYSSFIPQSHFDVLVTAGKRGFLPCMLAISFMHCKNVTLSPVDPPAALNRERRKAGLRPFVRYHTIDIEPMKRVLRTEGNIDAVGLKRALHLVRGHFATLTRNNKGEILEKSTVYWRESHVRGSLEHGMVVSDYRVHAPQGGGPNGNKPSSNPSGNGPIPGDGGADHGV